jgi:hypothetical protein
MPPGGVECGPRLLVDLLGRAKIALLCHRDIPHFAASQETTLACSSVEIARE